MKRIAWTYERAMDYLAWLIFVGLLGDIFEGWPSPGYPIPTITGEP